MGREVTSYTLITIVSCMTPLRPSLVLMVLLKTLTTIVLFGKGCATSLEFYLSECCVKCIQHVEMLPVHLIWLKDK